MCSLGEEGEETHLPLSGFGMSPCPVCMCLWHWGTRRLGQAVVLFWQAVFEGRADADPSAFANEVLLPTFFLPLIAAYFGKVVGGEWSRLDEE